MFPRGRLPTMPTSWLDGAESFHLGYREHTLRMVDQLILNHHTLFINLHYLSKTPLFRQS